MAEKKSYVYEIIIDTKNGTASINGTSIAMDKLEGKMRKLNAESQKLNNTLQKGTDKTGLAGAAVVELGRGVSDLNYGVTAVANNFSQLMTLMSTLVVTTGSLKNALASMWAVMKGPLGVVFLFQILTTVIEKIAIDGKKAAASINELEISIAKAGTELEVYLATAKDVTGKELELIQLRIEALKREAEFKGMIAKMDELKAEKVALEKTKVTDLVKWYEKAAIGLTSFLDGSMSATGFGEYMARVEKEGESQYLVDMLNIESQFDDLEIQFNNKSEEFGEYMNKKLASIFGKGKDGDKRDKVEGAELWKDPKLSFFTDLFDIDVQEQLQATALESLAEFYRDKNILDQQATSEEGKLSLARREYARLEAEQRNMSMAFIGDGIQSLGEIIGDQTEAGKAVAAAGAIISTYAAVTKALNTPGLGLARIPYAISVGAFGLAQVARIYQTNVRGNNRSAGIGGGEEARQYNPSFNVVGGSRIDQLNDTIRGELGKPARAYVVNKDVRSAGELERNIRNQGTVSG